MSYDTFTDEEVEVIRQAIKTAGGSIQDFWNGVDTYTVSFALIQYAGTGVSNLVRNYSKYMHKYGFSWPTEVELLHTLVAKPECWH